MVLSANEVYTLHYYNDYSDIEAVTKRVNGENIGLAERQEAYKLCEQIFQ